MGIFSFLSGTRRTLLDGAFWSGWFGSTNHSDEPVNEQTVNSIDAVYACNRLISETIGCLPFGMFEVESPRVLTPADGHPLHSLISLSPNADQTALEFWEGVVSHVALRGGAFRLKRYSLSGEVVSLEHLPPPPYTYWKRDPGTRVRRCVVSGGPHQGEYAEDDIFYVRGFGDDPDEGISVVRYAANDFGRQMSMGRHSAKMMANGARPNMILTTQELMTPEQRKQIKENIVSPVVGSKNAGGVMVLEAGFDMKQVTLSPADVQLIEQMGFGVETVCRWFRTPPTMIGHSGGQTSWGSGIDALLIGFSKFTVLPYTKRIVQAVQKQLLRPQDRSRFRPVMAIEGLMEGDSKTRADISKSKVLSGVWSVNEARAEDNLPPVEGGEDPRMQQQMVPLLTTIGEE